MRKAAARLMIAGTGSGCGKTTVACAILQALKDRGMDVAAFKCGPDYIDPMFHTEIIGAQSANIDLYFIGEDCARALFMRHAADLNVVEGVMGYYDGLSMQSDEASSYHVARALDAPAVLVVNGRGMALSVAAVVKGFIELRRPSLIAGVILNRVSHMSYPQLKETIERETGARVFGYMPTNSECALESRHLGLVTAQEVEDLRGKMRALAEQAERSIDLDGLIGLMRAQKELEARELTAPAVGSARIAVARDKAFCFYYRDNLDLLQDMGARLVYFSPLSDRELPECDGLILGGGYPELYARSLSENRSMMDSIKTAVEDGLPTIAECGGFMALTQAIDGAPMAGVIPARCHDAKKLSRFGYAELTAEGDSMLFAKGDSARAHEFHYWDADDPGNALVARKSSGRQWRCAWVSDTLYAGFPHLYFYSNPSLAERFVRKCLERRMRLETDGNRKTEL